MIRGSNFPVLLVIALYERQKYRETSLMEQFGDFAEKYVGTLPRRIKSAGKSGGSGTLRQRRANSQLASRISELAKILERFSRSSGKLAASTRTGTRMLSRTTWSFWTARKRRRQRWMEMTKAGWTKS